MLTIYATDYNATTAAIADAISESISRDEIAHVFPGRAVGYASAYALADELLTECESSVDIDSITEYTGVDIDGCTWRIHLHRPV